MPNALALASLLVPALASALTLLGREDEAELARRAERLLGDLARAAEGRRAALRVELCDLMRELSERVRRACAAHPDIVAEADYLWRELEPLLGLEREPFTCSPTERNAGP